jgi:hypothetical protein
MSFILKYQAHISIFFENKTPFLHPKNYFYARNTSRWFKPGYGMM